MFAWPKRPVINSPRIYVLPLSIISLLRQTLSDITFQPFLFQLADIVIRYVVLDLGQQ